MVVALTHAPSPRLAQGQRTFVEAQSLELEVALRQHERYCQVLAELGARVVRLEMNLDFPDSVFIEDTAVVLQRVAVLGRMGHPSRDGEPAGVEPVLRRYLPVARLEPPCRLEGGDVLRVGRKLLVGLSSRTNREGLEALQVLAPDYQVMGVPVRGCLHLKSACAALPDGRLLVNRDWIAEPPGFELVNVPSQEPHAANTLLLGDRVVMAAAYPRTADMLRSCGFEITTVDVSEFAKVEGCVTCMSLLVEAS